eukprot:Hpha_TRINITY_DN4870_c0_g1::TRINITY_DN4870_c0_g1_i1::g.20247::m.20247
MHVPAPPAAGTPPATRRPMSARGLDEKSPRAASSASGVPSAFGMRDRGMVNINLSPHRDLSARQSRAQSSQQNQNFVAAKEHDHPWKAEASRLVCPQRSPRFWWVYGCVEYKASEGEELCFKQAQQTLRRWLNHARRHDARAAVIFDVVTTRRNLVHGEAIGKAIYRFIDDYYDKDVAFVFVGLTDNTARRVARDIFCRNEELSRKKLSWGDIDDRHLRIVYPDESARPPPQRQAVQRTGVQSQSKRRTPPQSEDI